MAKYSIRELTDKQDHALADVQRMFAEMYNDMLDHGLMLELADNGPEKWLVAVTKSLGRFGILLFCYDETDGLGFAHGSIRLTPDYLGNQKVGVINHVFVHKKNLMGFHISDIDGCVNTVQYGKKSIVRLLERFFRPSSFSDLNNGTLVDFLQFSALLFNYRICLGKIS